MLYQKSLIDYVMEPSPSMNCFWSLIIMSSFLNENEKLKIVMSLPDELNHLKKPGLIHLLPNDWRIFLGGSSFNNDNDSHSHIYNINDYSHNHHQTNTNDDIVNIDNDSTNNNNHSNNNNGIAFFNLPSTLLTSDFNDNDDSSTTATIESSDIGYLDTNTQTITASTQVNNNNNNNNNSNNSNSNSNNFDEIVNEILLTRSTIILERVNSTINSSITNFLMRVLSGCDLDDSTLVGSFIVSISSLYYISSMMIEKRKLMLLISSSSSSSSLSSSLNHIQYLLGSLLTPILSIASLTTGSALCIRNRHYLRPLVRSYTSSCLYLNRLQLIIGKYINTTQTIILAALIMVSSLAIKYKIRYRHLKWIYQIALIRLLEIVKNMQGSIERMIER